MTKKRLLSLYVAWVCYRVTDIKMEEICYGYSRWSVFPPGQALLDWWALNQYRRWTE